MSPETKTIIKNFHREVMWLHFRTFGMIFLMSLASSIGVVVFLGPESAVSPLPAILGFVNTFTILATYTFPNQKELEAKYRKLLQDQLTKNTSQQ